MNRLGITEGEWIVDQEDVFARSRSSIEGNIICECPAWWNESMKKWNANAKLISDAGTTANKCGLLPSELLYQRDELLEALQKMCEYHEKMATCDKGDNGYYSAKSLIKKIESTK